MSRIYVGISKMWRSNISYFPFLSYIDIGFWVDGRHLVPPQPRFLGIIGGGICLVSSKLSPRTLQTYQLMNQRHTPPVVCSLPTCLLSGMAYGASMWGKVGCMKHTFVISLNLFGQGDDKREVWLWSALRTLRWRALRLNLLHQPHVGTNMPKIAKSGPALNTCKRILKTDSLNISADICLEIRQSPHLAGSLQASWDQSPHGLAMGYPGLWTERFRARGHGCLGYHRFKGYSCFYIYIYSNIQYYIFIYLFLFIYIHIKSN